MKDLAVVLITCDKYSWIWDTWYHYFKKYWGIECPVYFCNETKEMNYPGIKQILVNEPNPHKWTKRARESINQIPEDHLFILLDDLIFCKDITEIFRELYQAFIDHKADALRIRPWPTSADIRNINHFIHGRKLKLLTQRSKYLATFSPNIWNKEYALKALRKNESIWMCETSSRLKHKGYKVYDYEIIGWCVNAIKQGELTKEGAIKVQEYEDALDRH